MAFPTNLTNAVDGSTDALAAHINNLEAKVGIDSSAVTTSHDYKLGEVTGSDKAVGKTATQTLTNKTLTSPVINSPTGDVATLTGTQTLTNKTLTSPKIGTDISDTNGNELLKLTATASAVNELTLANAAASGTPQLAATGSDTDISVDIRGKGAGVTKGGIRYQASTTNSNQNGVWFQGGWCFIAGDGTTTASKTVTFPTAFTTILGVVTSPLGYKDSSDPTAITDFLDYGILSSMGLQVSTTNFVARFITVEGSTVAASRRIGISWLAWGI